LSPWDDISRAVAAATGKPFKINQRASVGGGCINSAYRIEGGDTGYFVKLNSAGKAEMFAAEAAGLQEIARSHTLRVPRPICPGANHTASWLVLEYIALARRALSTLPPMNFARIDSF